MKELYIIMSDKEPQFPSAPLLDSIHSPEDLKNLPPAELPLLCEEIRREIIRVVCRTGGHLASSLGAVELIVALHYVLNTPEDKIVFDVGHQAYAHKILTGRREAFENLRHKGGTSGFPKMSESNYDAFDTGHSSTSISAALGLACARDLRGDGSNVVAVLGDGAFTGGMAMEAMNHAGALKKKLLVILNDNNMSISPNVGGISEYMSLLVTRPSYIRFRKKVKTRVNQCLPSRGTGLLAFLRRFEDALKSFFTRPSTLFEAAGFKYLGPFDGHDMGLLIDALTGATAMDRPILMHVVTTKGKGYPPAEEDPLTFHGMGAVKAVVVTEMPQEQCDLLEPEGVKSASEKKTGRESFSALFGRFLVAEAEHNPKVVAITAAMSEGTGLSLFYTKYPDRSFDVGIAEAHAVTLAAGLAAAEGGYRPVVAVYSSFLQRAFDQLFHDVALPDLPVLVAVDRAGPVGEDGPTHHGGLDLAYLRLLPNFTVMVPADGADLAAMIKLGLSFKGPSAIRYPRGEVPAEVGLNSPLEPGRGVILRPGTAVSIMALGPPAAEALIAARNLEKQGISAEVINLRFIKPIDRELILSSAAKTGRVLTLEEGSLTGGLLDAVSQILVGSPVLLRGLGMTDELLAQDSQQAQRAGLGLDAAGIEAAVRKMLR